MLCLSGVARPLIGFEVVQDIFPDHAVLVGRFQQLSARAQVKKWFVPSQFPWPKSFQVDPQFWQKQNVPATDRYVALWRHIEGNAAAQVPFAVPNNAFGRGQTLNTRTVSDLQYMLPPCVLRARVIFSRSIMEFHVDMRTGFAKSAGCKHMPGSLPM